MKFFYINNDVCLGCDNCISNCPTVAVYDSYGKKFINYDKCITCGKCYRDCQAGAITIERLEKITVQMESLDRYREQVQRLEDDKADLMYKVKNLTESIYSLIENLPVAACIADSAGEVLSYNMRFTELMSPDITDSSERTQVLRFNNIAQVLPESVLNIYNKAAANAGVSGALTHMSERNVSVSVYPLSQGDLTVMVIRDLSDGGVLRDEVAGRLRATVDRKLEMVQKIGFLLGEEVSTTVENLNSVIDIIDGSWNKAGDL